MRIKPNTNAYQFKEKRIRICPFLGKKETDTIDNKTWHIEEASLWKKKIF